MALRDNNCDREHFMLFPAGPESLAKREGANRGSSFLPELYVFFQPAINSCLNLKPVRKRPLRCDTVDPELSATVDLQVLSGRWENLTLRGLVVENSLFPMSQRPKCEVIGGHNRAEEIVRPILRWAGSTQERCHRRSSGHSHPARRDAGQARPSERGSHANSVSHIRGS